MALPPSSSLTSSEIAFLAEDEPVFIVPRYAMAALDLGGWQVPPLRPMRRVEVPLWLAVLLRKQGRCALVFPPWMDTEPLEKKLEFERENSLAFAELPWMWQPVSHALVQAASEDYTGDLDTLQTLLQGIWELRQAKMRQGIALINDGHIELSGLGYMEVNQLRPFLSKSMLTLEKVRGLAES